MSLVNRRVVQVHHNFSNQRGMHHHLLLHMCLESEVSIVARIRSTSRQVQLSLNIVRNKKKLSLLHILSVVETTQEIVVMARQVVLGVVKRVTS